MGWGQGIPTITTDANGNGTIEDSEKILYLIQTNQFQSFYLVPASDGTHVSTNNIPNTQMLWYFLDAGTEGTTQYYYIVCNSNNKCIWHSDGTANTTSSREVKLVEKDASNEESCKFKLIADNSNGTVGFYNIDVKGNPTYYGLNKQNGSVNISNPVRLTNTQYIHDYSSKWKFIPYNGSFIWPDPPFTPSTNSQNYYYKIHNIVNGSYYVSSDASTPKNVTISSTASDNMVWYFIEASTDSWIKYYYIVNPVAGEYMYYKGTATNGSNQSNAIVQKAKTSENEDRFQFIIVQTARTVNDVPVECYTIIPKLLKDQYWNSNCISPTSIVEGNKLGIRNGRGTADNNSHWGFEPTVYPMSCAITGITYSSETGKITITATPADAEIHYTTDGTDPSSGTLYSVPFDVSSPVTIKAIATKTGYDPSEVETVSFDQVSTPGFELTDDGKVRLTCATSGASIYYAMGDTQPTSVTIDPSNLYSVPIENAAGKFITAVAVKDGLWINSTPLETGQIMFPCATPVIRKTSATTFTIECSYPTSGVTIYYNTGDGSQADPTDASTQYFGVVTFNESDLPFTVKAIAYATDYNPSAVATQVLTVDLPLGPDGYYEIANDNDFATFVSMVNENATNAGANYKIIADINASGANPITEAFTGELKGVAKADGSFPVVSYLSHAIFNTIDGGTVKNVILDNVGISSDTNVGAICNEATGDSRIYNCGVLATGSTATTNEDGYTEITSCSSTISGSGFVGGLVGLLDGSSRVINCFSYANITGGDLVGGIVGKNNVATNADNTDTDHYLKTMVMNCMFYGDIDWEHTTNRAPIYNGEIITNRSDAKGVSNFNYFWAGASYVQGQDIDKYNCALAAETRFLQRFEFFRHLLNSNRELAAWWATGDFDNKDEMLKWVLEPSQIGTTTPYPILKAPCDNENHIKKYPSVVNIDADNAEAFSSDPATAKTQYNQGRKFNVTFTINIQNATSGAPEGANINTPSITRNVTDKDPKHFNFNYYKVQLPYYNEVGTKNYTENKVVTGWEVTVSGGTNSFSNSSSDATASVNANGDITLTTPYNFADRKSTEKDNYATSGRIFSQGAYYDVPEGVTSITIKPHWAKCVYVSDEYPDVIYDKDMTTASNVTTVGTDAGTAHYTNGNTYSINEDNQKVYTTMANAVSALNPSGTVYDNAIVLVGNVHSLDISNKTNSKPYTIMSIDLDKDNEPDYSYILRFNSRVRVHPVRVDFLNIIGLGMAQKSHGGTGTYNLGILQPLGWFESTNTSLFRFTQFEYDKKDRVNSPMILQGGVIEQWVTVGGKEESIKEGKTVTYYHVGGNVWFKEFHIGVHQDKTQDEFVSPHPPISVTGGDFNEFYLTGLYNTPNANTDDNAECYINGGRFKKVAGTGMQGIGGMTNHTNGTIIWQIDNADIDEFYAGGINAAHIAEGDIRTVISNSRVDQFCGGPKFGNMNSDKKVVTNATNCTFRTFFGAGYGGNSYNRRYPDNKNNVTNINWDEWVAQQYTKKYDSNYGGVETRIDYQFIPMSGNESNVARLFVDYVSFSLATTHDVTSKLTGCTITTSALGGLDLFSECIGNFYGGGSLGKVDGLVKSTLTNCTVEGNVFGAGYSATKPTVAVMNNSFQTEPYYDENSGFYLDAVLPATVPYTWEHAETVNSTATAINTNTHKLFTTVDLSDTNLGSVGSAKLTLKGNTTVGGNVFGGGQQSTVNGTGTLGNTEVYLQGNTHVAGNVYGGGDQGAVSGNSKVIIQEESDTNTQQP